MEHLDDFIREQFRQDDPAGRFPFREEYWEQALALIEADERKRRRGLLWWWFAGFLLVAGLGWWGWQCSRTSMPKETTADLKKSDFSGAAPLSQAPARDISGSAATTTTIPANTSNNVAASPQLKNAANAPNNLETSNSTNVKSYYPTASQQTLTTKNGAQKAAVSHTLSDIQQVPGIENSNSHTQQKTATIANTTGINAEHAPAAINSVTPANSNSGIVTTSTSDLPGENILRQNLTSLPTEFQPLTSGLVNFHPAQMPTTAIPIKPVQETKFAIGLDASATTYMLASSGLKLGATGGIYAEYWFRPAWSVSAGLDLRSQPLITSAADSQTVISSQLQYRFGYEQTTYRREDRSLYFYEIPLGLHWHYRAWQLETGVRFGHLFSGRTVQIQSSRSSLQPDPETQKSIIKIDLSTYRRNYAGYFAGIGWQPIHRLQFELRGTYRPASILKPNGEALAPTGGFWLDAGVRWQLFTRPRNRVK